MKIPNRYTKGYRTRRKDLFFTRPEYDIAQDGKYYWWSYCYSGIEDNDRYIVYITAYETKEESVKEYLCILLYRMTKKKGMKIWK